jgi:hypothetical protein
MPIVGQFSMPIDRFINFLGMGEYELTDIGYGKAKEFENKYPYKKWESVYREQKPNKKS